MKLVKVLTVVRRDPDDKGVDLTRRLSGDERVSLLEDLRREMCEVAGIEYPERMERVLEVVRRKEY
jgi:hypothetical protein